MRKIGKKQAVVTAWMLIATLGISPMVSVAGVSTDAENEHMVYTEVNHQKNGKMVQESLDIENASPSDAKVGADESENRENSSLGDDTEHEVTRED